VWALRLIALLTLGLSSIGTLVCVPGAEAETCFGAGNDPCPYISATVIGQRAEGVLRFPEAVAIGPEGDIYVADQLGYVVQKFSPQGIFETEWGSFGAGHGQFGPIGGLATDAEGDVYVVDSSHDRIEKFDAGGGFITAWGHAGQEPGEFNFGSSQNPSHPPGGGIAVSGSYVYVADSANDRIERFNLQGGEVMTWGTKGAGPGQFSYPRAVAANAGEVIVSDDDNHRIEQFTPAGAYLASAGTEGDGPGQFAYPYGVALDAAGNVYVADDSNDRIVKLTPQLGFAGAWGGDGSKPGQLAFPRALASDAAGDTYVADTANDRIEVFGPEGEYLRTLGISAHGPGQLTAPRGLAVDPTGRLLASDTVGNRVELFAPSSELYTAQWTTAGGRFGDLNGPAGIAVDELGAVLVSDPGNGRVARFWGDGTFLSEIGGPGDLGGAALSGAGALAISGPAAGDQTYVADSGHNRILIYGPEGVLRAAWGAAGGSGAPGSAPGSFNHPSAVAVTPAGQVYVADSANNRVVELSPAGAVLTEWGGRGTAEGRFHSPDGIALDGAGNVYVLDGENNRVEVFTPSGRFLTEWGDRGTGLGQFSQPAALAIGCEGSVYVADTNNNRIERFDLADPAPSGCLPAAAWPPPLDVAPVLEVTLARSRGILADRGLVLTVSCRRDCKILASATLRARNRRREAALIAAARPLAAGVPAVVRLLVGPRTLAILRRQLGRRRGLLAHITVIAEGPTGRRTTLTRSYLVTR